MPKFSFNNTYETVAKEYNLEKGQYFKFKEGPNRLRLISVCLPHDGSYNGKPTFKWLCQILDRTDGRIKPFFMPNSIYKTIADYQLSDDYAFDEVPMPYDITINAKNAGKLEVEYTVTPARQNTLLTVEELKAIEDAPTVQELQAKIREKDTQPRRPVEEEKAEIVDEIDLENIPF